MALTRVIVLVSSVAIGTSQATQVPARFAATPLTTHGLVRLAGQAPAISPNGRWIAYTRFQRPGPEVRSEVWLLDRKTTKEEVLVPRARVSSLLRRSADLVQITLRENR